MMAVDVRFSSIADFIQCGSLLPCSHTPEALLCFFTECRGLQRPLGGEDSDLGAIS